ncbi:hypothetical protein BaRGS_00004392 [Batillaria attramentaria]|uniref:Uncharacterized protein n=1 Tax=Batillaria attramentaria TaxID=370345 RepID=A0ABD0LZD9_9CAEN
MLRALTINSGLRLQLESRENGSHCVLGDQIPSTHAQETNFSLYTRILSWMHRDVFGEVRAWAQQSCIPCTLEGNEGRSPEAGAVNSVIRQPVELPPPPPPRLTGRRLLTYGAGPKVSPLSKAAAFPHNSSLNRIRVETNSRCAAKRAGIGFLTHAWH